MKASLSNKRVNDIYRDELKSAKIELSQGDRVLSKQTLMEMMSDIYKVPLHYLNFIEDGYFEVDLSDLNDLRLWEKIKDLGI